MDLADVPAAGNPLDAQIAALLQGLQQQQARYDSLALSMQNMQQQHQLQQQQWLQQMQQMQHAMPQPNIIAPHTSRPKPIKPLRFKGDKEDSAGVAAWIFNVEKFFEASHVLDDLERIAYAVTLLDRNALAWWMTVEKEKGVAAPSTWEAWKAALTAMFQPANLESEAREKLDALRQTGTVSSYAFTMRRLMLDVPGMTSAEKIHRFVHGLKPSIQRELRIREPTSFDDAVATAERIDNVSLSFRVPFGRTSVPSTHSYRSSQLSPWSWAH